MLRNALGWHGSWLAASMLLGCTGEVGGDQPASATGASPISPPITEPAPGSCSEGSPLGPAPMRRLTRREYNNTVRDLFGDVTAPASSWLADPSGESFDNDAAAQATTRQHVEQFKLTAGEVAERALPQLETQFPCPGSGVECGQAFIEQVGAKAYRRPLDPAETAALAKVYSYGSTQSGHALGMRLALEAMLQAPQFLYLTTTGATPGAGASRVRLTGYETAARLSYFLWGSAPDASLTQAAASGQLDSNEGVRIQAERLLADPRAQQTIAQFYDQWLALNDLEGADRSPEEFPSFTPELAASLLAGTRAFVTETSTSGTFTDLMTGSFGFVDALTAANLGIAAAPGVLTRVELPSAERSGILTDPGVLAAHSSYAGHSPVARGVYIRQNVMCDPLPSPPQDIQIEPPAPDPTRTTRERFEAHRTDPACAACHRMIDGIGMAFENYDALGRYRTEENGRPIDARGEIYGYGDSNGEVTGAIEFSQALAQSDAARQCFSSKWFQFAVGRQATPDDQCALDELHTRFADNDFEIAQLLVSITQSDAFLYRPAVAVEECGL